MRPSGTNWSSFQVKDRRHRWAVGLSQRHNDPCLAVCDVCGKRQKIANLGVHKQAFFTPEIGVYDGVVFVEPKRRYRLRRGRPKYRWWW